VKRVSGKKNHYAKVCTSQPKDNGNCRQAHSVATEDLFIGTINKQLNINTVQSSDAGWYVLLEIQQQNIRLRLDTGARCNVLPMYIFQNLHSAKQLTKTNTRLLSYSGNVMHVEGEVVLDTYYKGHKFSIQYYVVDHPAAQPILGLKSCEQLNLIRRVEEMRTCPITEEDIFEQYEDLFATKNIGCLPKIHHIEIDENVMPVVHAPRQVPAAIQLKIKA
jgi:hypothetical protein